MVRGIAWVLGVKILVQVKIEVLGDGKDVPLILSQGVKKNTNSVSKPVRRHSTCFFPIAAGLWGNEFKESQCYPLRDTMSAC